MMLYRIFFVTCSSCSLAVSHVHTGRDVSVSKFQQLNADCISTPLIVANLNAPS